LSEDNLSLVELGNRILESAKIRQCITSAQLTASLADLLQVFSEDRFSHVELGDSLVE
jgi:hypothetical protein